MSSKEPSAEEKKAQAKQFASVLGKIDSLMDKATQGGKTPLDLSFVPKIIEGIEKLHRDYLVLAAKMEAVSEQLDAISAFLIEREEG